MSKLRVESFTISIDGYGAGAEQTLTEPMGLRGESLHGWAMATRTFQAMMGDGEGADGVDEDFASRGFVNIGAWVMGRNMFGPVRGDWPDETWQGWWGEEPPYHCDVYVLTHYPRASFEMKGGTVFHFLSASPAEVLARATAVAGGQDVRIGGGASTVRDFLRAGLVDDLHVAIAPIILGRGIRLWDDLRGLENGASVTSVAAASNITHVTLRR